MAVHETVRLTRRQALATSLASGLAAMAAKPAPAASEAAAKTLLKIGCGTVSFGQKGPSINGKRGHP